MVLPTYKQIQTSVRSNIGISVKTCWIAEVKREMGLTRGPAPNRGQGAGAPPCPPHYKEAIRRCIRESLAE